MKSLTDILKKRGTTEEQKDELLTQVNQAKDKADGIRTLYIERFNESYQYYNSKKPGRDIIKAQGWKNESFETYVEPILYNAVKAALPQLIGTFTEDDSLAFSFRSRGFHRNPLIEDLITYNINKIFLREQDGYHTLENMFKETLVTGDSFAKVYVDEVVHREKFNLSDWVELSDFMSNLEPGWTIETPKKFGANESGKHRGFEWKEETETIPDPETGEPTEQPLLFIKGRIPLINKDKKVKVEHIDSNDLWIDHSYGHDFKKCPYIAHRIRTTIGECKLRGFDEEKLTDAKREIIDSKLPEFNFSAALYQDPAIVYGELDASEDVDPNNKKIDTTNERQVAEFRNKIWCALSSSSYTT